jgi:hypothetical protein
VHIAGLLGAAYQSREVIRLVLGDNESRKQIVDTVLVRTLVVVLGSLYRSHAHGRRLNALLHRRTDK